MTQPSTKDFPDIDKLIEEINLLKKEVANQSLAIKELFKETMENPNSTRL